MTSYENFQQQIKRQIVNAAKLNGLELDEMAERIGTDAKTLAAEGTEIDLRTYFTFCGLFGYSVDQQVKQGSLNKPQIDFSIIFPQLDSLTMLEVKTAVEASEYSHHMTKRLANHVLQALIDDKMEREFREFKENRKKTGA